MCVSRVFLFSFSFFFLLFFFSQSFLYVTVNSQFFPLKVNGGKQTLFVKFLLRILRKHCPIHPLPYFMNRYLSSTFSSPCCLRGEMDVLSSHLPHTHLHDHVTLFPLHNLASTNTWSWGVGNLKVGEESATPRLVGRGSGQAHSNPMR